MENTIGKIIKEERKKQGLSVFRLAVKSDVTDRAIQNYEKGTRTPRIEILDRILKILGITIKIGKDSDLS